MRAYSRRTFGGRGRVPRAGRGGAGANKRGAMRGAGFSTRTQGGFEAGPGGHRGAAVGRRRGWWHRGEPSLAGNVRERWCRVFYQSHRRRDTPLLRPPRKHVRRGRGLGHGNTNRVANNRRAERDASGTSGARGERGAREVRGRRGRPVRGRRRRGVRRLGTGSRRRDWRGRL